MPFKCKTTAGPWESHLTPTNPAGPTRGDGEIVVDDDSTGVFTGMHLDSGGLILGKCTGSTGSDCAGECKIEFQRRSREGNRLYRWEYTANFTFENTEHRTTNGTYKKFRLGMRVVNSVLENSETVEEEGTWVATKPVT